MTELEIKAAVRARDGHRCTRCGITAAIAAAELAAALTVREACAAWAEAAGVPMTCGCGREIARQIRALDLAAVLGRPDP